jgi:hypothetical protein
MKRLSEENRNLVCKLYLQKESLEFIRKELNICDSSIYRILKENNIAKNRDTKESDFNPDCRKERNNRYCLEHKEEIKNQKKKYYEDNKEIIKERQKEYNLKNKEQVKGYNKGYRKNLKRKVFDTLGGCKCFLCGDNISGHLTVDHIDNTGYIDKRIGLGAGNLYSSIVKGKYPQDKISNLRVLCWNHNLSRRREYLNVPSEDQTAAQRWQTKLWKEAFNFFGPCHCGISDLKFLTISHIHNDGAERKRNGEPRGGLILLIKFRKLGWPESLKEDFCLECFNHNCEKL